MSLVLSSTQSSTLEPLRKNRWVLQFTTVPGGGEASNLAFCAHTARRPSITYNVQESQRLNERFYTAGKPTWSELPMTFYDYIQGEKSVSQTLWNWNLAIYNPVTGAMGFKKDYATSATLGMLDPSGGIAQVWNMFYIWPYTIDWQELSSEDDGFSEVACTFRYDFAINASNIDTSV